MGMTTSKPQAVAKGFKPKRTVYVLDFSGTDLEGLEVRARGSSLDEVLAMMEDADKISDLQQLDEKADAAKVARNLRELVAPFARKLVSWNLLGDDDEPVPASPDGLMSQELGFVTSLITAYGQSMTQAPPPLPAPSEPGTTSPAELEAMAALSQSLPSSSPQRLLSRSATAGTACRRSCSGRTRGCCGCSTSTGSATGTRTRREVNSGRWRTTTSASASRRPTAPSRRSTTCRRSSTR